MFMILPDIIYGSDTELFDVCVVGFGCVVGVSGCSSFVFSNLLSECVRRRTGFGGKRMICVRCACRCRGRAGLNIYINVMARIKVAGVRHAMNGGGCVGCPVMCTMARTGNIDHYIDRYGLNSMSRRVLGRHLGHSNGGGRRGGRPTAGS